MTQRRPPSRPGARPAGKPVTPAKPGNFGKPAAPAKPGGFGRPAAPAKPGGFGRPAAPAKPGGFGRPAAPAKPGGFGRPAAPAKPGGFGKPTAPAKPGGFGRPAAPAKPGGFGRPATPAKPGGFGRPAAPAKPGGFGRPANPSKPGVRPVARPAIRTVAPVKPAAPAITFGARMVALDVLQDVHQQDAYASLALNKRLTASRLLDGRDKRLVTELVYGTLENRIRLDYMVDFFLERKDVEPVVRDILRMGAYQLFFLDRVPGSAAVDEAVKLTRAKGKEQYTGLVNAVLRNMIRDKQRIVYPKPSEEPVRFLSVMHSVPQWIVERLIAAYSLADARAICEHRAPDAPVTVRPNLHRTTTAEFEGYLARRHFKFEPGLVPGAYHLFGAGDLAQEPEYLRGVFSIQGESSMLAAQAVGVQPGWSVLDACAAPGGKTALLAEALGGTGRVYAWDLHEHRVELIRAMVRRLYLENVRPVQRDAALLKQDIEGTMDAVLVDAPCSGLGVMLNKPDVKYRQTPEGVQALVAMQAQILGACSRYVKPGGVLVYSTCSILPEENAGQIAAFLAAHPDFVLEGLAERLPEALRARATDGQLQLLAHRDGIDGFYIARMVRKRS